MLGGPLRTLGHRHFALVWAASMLSAFGTWMQVAAVGIFAAEATGRVAWVAVVLTASWLSMGLVSPWAGALADRYDRRVLVGVAQLGQAVATLGLVAAFASDFRSPYVVAVVAIVDGALAAVSRPAFTALTGDLLPSDELVEANSLQQVSWNAARALSPMLAVGVLAVSSYEVVFAFNGLSFLAVVAVMTMVRERARPPVGSGRVWAQIREGVAAVRADSRLRFPIHAALAEMTLAAPIVALVPAMSQLTLHGSPRDTGVLFTALAVGSTVGALLLTPLIKRAELVDGMHLMLAGLGVVGLGYALSPNIWFAGLLLLPLGAFHTNIYASAVAQLQQAAQPEIRGRVIALFYAVTGIGYALASTALAALADAVGVRPVIFGSCAVLLVIAKLLPSRDSATSPRADRSRHLITESAQQTPANPASPGPPLAALVTGHRSATGD